MADGLNGNWTYLQIELENKCLEDIEYVNAMLLRFIKKVNLKHYSSPIKYLQIPSFPFLHLHPLASIKL
jgi:hypothetical protein